MICLVTNIVMAGYGFFIVFFGFYFGNTLVKLIIQGIFLCFVLLTNISAIIELVISIFFIELSANFPEYVLNTIDKNYYYYGHGHFWPYFPLLIFNIIFFTLKFIKCQKEMKERNKEIQSIEQTPSTMIALNDAYDAPPIEDKNQYSKPTP